MKGFRKTLVFLLFFALLGTATFCLFQSALTDMAQNAAGLRGNRVYTLCAAGADGVEYIVRMRANGTNALRRIGADGKVKETAFDKKLPGQYEIADFSVASNGTVLLGIYELDGCMPVNYTLYSSPDGASTLMPLITAECMGDTAPARRAFIWRSDISETVPGTLRFFIYEDGVCIEYEYDTALAQGIVQKRGFAVNDAVSGAYDGKGALLFTAHGALVRVEEDGTQGEVAPANAYRAAQLFTVEEGAAFINGASGELMRVTSDGVSAVFSANVQEAAYVALGRDMRVLALTGNDRLVRIADGVVTDISDKLIRSPLWSALALVGIILVEAVIAYGFCYLVCEANGMYFPLAIRNFLLILLVGFWSVTLLMYFAVAPAYMENVRRGVFDTVGFFADSVTADAELEEETAMLARADARLADVTAEPVDAGAQEADGASVESANGKTNYTVVSGSLRVTVNASLIENAAAHELMLMALWCYAGVAAIALVVSLRFGAAARGARRVRKGIDLVASGCNDVRVVNSSGDELEALTGSFNDLAGALNKGEERAGQRSQAYLRFVPSQLLELLGAKGIEDVDKTKSASLTLAMMVVRFRFPQSVYQSDDKTLFENINGVFERVGAVVSRGNGAIYNFTYDGFDAVFETGSLAAVSAAVLIRQETLELNAERVGRGEEPVELRVALDCGAAMLGVVGDRDRMVPTVASSCLSTARDLVELASTVGANILCTASVAEAAEEYRVRYIGKRRDGEELIRVYEVTDGDDYEVRLAKESVREQFTNGVYALYAKDFSGAKRIFMDIARSQSGDGVARHYLYLADSFEKNVPDEVGL